MEAEISKTLMFNKNDITTLHISRNESHVAGPVKPTSSAVALQKLKPHMLPTIGPDPSTVWTGQVVPAWHAKASYNWTEYAV